MTIYISHDNCYTFKRFLKIWGRALEGKIRFIYYADLPHRRALPREVSIFTDLERLSPAQLKLAEEAAQQLKNAGVAVLNDPAHVLRRYDLLRAMHESGINDFQCFRLNDDRSALRFPAFLRLENEHQGSLSELVHSAQELEQAIDTAVGEGLKPEELLIVEYCDTSGDDGIFRKYAAFVIGDVLATRHVLFSRRWLLKKPDIVGTDKVLEEQRYLDQNPHPHAAPLRAIFKRAGIDYGRIDYGMREGKIQVWEINTNPSITPETAIAPERMAGQMQAREQICAALEKLIASDRAQCAGSTPAARVPFQVSKATRQALGVRPSDWWRHPLRRAARPLSSYRARRLLRKLRLAK
jgi:hypothetical protein